MRSYTFDVPYRMRQYIIVDSCLELMVFVNDGMHRKGVQATSHQKTVEKRDIPSRICLTVTGIIYISVRSS